MDIKWWFIQHYLWYSNPPSDSCCSASFNIIMCKFDRLVYDCPKTGYLRGICWWRGWFWKPWVFMVQNCQSSPSLPELVCSGNIQETLEPFNTRGPKIMVSCTSCLFNQSKNGETQRSHLHLHVCWRNPNKAQFVSCVVNMYMKIIISDQSQSYFHQLTISLLVETCWKMSSSH